MMGDSYVRAEENFETRFYQAVTEFNVFQISPSERFTETVHVFKSLPPDDPRSRCPGVIRDEGAATGKQYFINGD